MAIEQRQVNGITGLVQEVLAIANGQPPGGFLWFRGISCGTHTLIPKIMRDGKPMEQVFEREMRLLTRFRQRSMAYWPAGYPQNDWEHLFAMQHFGMPTRLLDWSENLFVAAHFALESAPQHAHEGGCVPVVWCVDPGEWNRSTPVLSEYGESIQVLTTADDELDAYRPETNKRRKRSPIAMFGAHNSARIVAQRGTFMVWGSDTRPLEEIGHEQTARLWRIEVQGQRADLSKSLTQLGFSETMVFPELPSLSSELSRTEGWRT
ncbi:FRG domain-containing protein [Ramlibacter sp. WS9]|uniref:FRG domain-containing protein n=1 Tax=Ramlibacter sp. WS9 TaxID=1882741 RepID=UPI001144B1C6|nr:FRG domain-containing protein [Ramlibacter sp. WS9]ROZ77023.1 FRG domain-containing protein [Ramlibacter sp. WS9]